MKSNYEIRQTARQELKGFWTMPVLATLVYVILSTSVNVFSSTFFRLTGMKVLGVAMAAMGTIGLILMILVLAPLTYGFTLSFLDFLRADKEDTVIQLFAGFKSYGRAIKVTVLMYVYIILWAFLLFIPGFIKSLSYAMTIFISKDHPELSADECIERSMSMMDGHKTDLFLLYLSFIGWAFLCVFTLGIGYLWLMPYMQVSLAAFYEELKADYETEYEESSIL